MVQDHSQSIQVGNAPFIHKWVKFKIGGFLSTVICGQIQDGQPAGFCRVIDEYGNFLEGFFDSNFKANGFTRSVNSSGFQYIGWWKEGVFHGNGKWFKPDGKVDKEGWFEGG